MTASARSTDIGNERLGLFVNSFVSIPTVGCCAHADGERATLNGSEFEIIRHFAKGRAYLVLFALRP